MKICFLLEYSTSFRLSTVQWQTMSRTTPHHILSGSRPHNRLYIPSSIFQECHRQGSGETAGLNPDGGGFLIKHGCNWVGRSGGEQQGERSSPPLPSACQYLHLCSSLPGDEACSYSRFSWQQWQHYLKNSFSAGISVHTWGLRAPRKCRGKCDEAFVEKKAGARTGDWLLMLLLIMCQF